MKVNALTVVTAAAVGLAIGVFATGRVGGVVLPLLFVLACPLMVLFIKASMTGAAGPPEEPEVRAPKQDGVARGPRVQR